MKWPKRFAVTLVLALAVIAFYFLERNSPKDKQSGVEQGSGFYRAHAFTGDPVAHNSAHSATGTGDLGRPEQAIRKTPPINQTLVRSSVDLPERLKPIIQNRTARDYSIRIKAIQAVESNLSGDEVDALCDFLRDNGPQNERDRNYDLAVKNEILSLLRGLEPPPLDLTDFLIITFQDKGQDIVMRDYVLQHLASWYPKADVSERQIIQRTLWQATAETGTSIGGTSLLALYRIAQSDPEVDTVRIAQRALKFASEEQCGELTRTTAIQLCALLHVEEFMPVALDLAGSGGSIPLRLSAIAAVGDLGGNEAEQYLLERKWDDARLAVAAQSALRRLHGRMGNQKADIKG